MAVGCGWARKMTTVSRRWAIAFRNGSIACSWQGQILWSVDLDKVVLIGEYTNANGPLLDDYFLVFVTADGRWFQVSVCAVGFEEVLVNIAAALGARLPLALANSASWAARILWPATVAGEPLFDLVEVEPRGLWQRVLRRLGHRRTRASLSQAASAFIAEGPG